MQLFDRKKRKIIAIDFDGTICKVNASGDFVVNEGTKESLMALANNGFKIVIHSCRFGIAHKSGDLVHEQMQVSDFLDENGIVYHEIHLGEKLIADYYVDDRAIRFRGDWKEVLDVVAESL